MVRSFLYSRNTWSRDAKTRSIARQRVRDFDLFDRYTEKLLDIFRSEEPVDVQSVFARLTLDAAGEFLFGTKDLNTLDRLLPRAGFAKLGLKGAAQPEGSFGGFAQAFEALQNILRIRVQMPDMVWPLLEMWTDSAAQHSVVADKWAEPLIQQALLEKEKRLAGGQVLGDEGCLTDHLVDQIDGGVFFQLLI